jgi:5-methylcytosine-specific restriction endonuclease McrA
MVQNSLVLVLNQNYEPLNVCSARRALTLVMSSKAEVLEAESDVMRSPSVEVQRPSVIRLHYLIHRPRRRIALNRHEVFLRDDFTCQYCGLRTRDLTLDHVIPRSKGGRDSWENLVSACKTCNHRKGQRTPEQAKMHLRTLPREPRPNPYRAVRRFAPDGKVRDKWQVYLPG